MVDIDLLVKPEEIETAAETMERLGYVRDELYYSDAFNRARGYHLLFIHPAGDLLAVEIQWRLASLLEQRNTLTATTLQAQMVRARVGGMPGVAVRDTRILAPEAQIVYLATHAAKERHTFSDLKLLGDITAIAGGPRPLAWASVCRLARQVQACAATYVVLALSRDLLGLSVPPAALAQLRPPHALLWAVERTLNPATILDPITEDRRTAVKYLVVDRPAVTARLLLEHVLPPADAIREYYPEWRQSSLALVYPLHVVTLSEAAARKAALWLRQ
jgi:hypothetical protein